MFAAMAIAGCPGVKIKAAIEAAAAYIKAEAAKGASPSYLVALGKDAAENLGVNLEVIAAAVAKS